MSLKQAEQVCQSHRTVAQKSEILSLADGLGWAPIITARVFASYVFGHPQTPTNHLFFISWPL